MISKFIKIALVTLLVLPCLAETRRENMEKYTELNITAVVTNIDYELREATLTGPLGNMVTITAGPQIKRFNEIKTGDKVKAVYKTMTRAEFRDPTPEELKNPLIILEDDSRNSDGSDPRARAGKIIKAVVWVKQVSLPTSSVTIKGPRGKYLTLPVEDQALLHELKVGERVVLTYAEAIAVALDKVE